MAFALAEPTLTFLVLFFVLFLILFFSTHYSSHDISRPHLISIPIPIPSSLYNFVLVLAFNCIILSSLTSRFLYFSISPLSGHLCPTKLSLHNMFYFFMYFHQSLVGTFVNTIPFTGVFRARISGFTWVEPLTLNQKSESAL